MKCRYQAEVLKDKYKLDYLEIIDNLTSEKAAITREEWITIRKAAGKPPSLEKLPEE